MPLLLLVSTLVPLQIPRGVEGFFVVPKIHHIRPTPLIPSDEAKPSWTGSAVFAEPPSSSSSSSSSEEANDEAIEPAPKQEGIDVSTDERLYRVRLGRATGIEWGTDLSFSFVYVRSIEPAGSAAASGKVSIGDQLCELRPVVDDDDDSTEVPPINLVGAPFDRAMESFTSLGRSVRSLDLVFFRGTKDDLIAAATANNSEEGNDDDTVVLTVIQNKGTRKEEMTQFEVPRGCNVRQELTDRGINVYQSLTRWTNCKGRQLCGTCIVNISPDTSHLTNRKSIDEASTLRENPDTYRLSCVTFAYGDVTVETFPPVNPAQWTR